MQMLLFYRLLFMAELFTAEFLFIFRLPKKKLFALRFAGCVLLGAGIAAVLPLYYNTFYTSFTFALLFGITVPMLKFCCEGGWENMFFCGIAAYTVQHFAYGVANIFLTIYEWGTSPIFNMYFPGEMDFTNISYQTVLAALFYLLGYYLSYTALYAIYARKIKRGKNFRLKSTSMLVIVAVGLFVDIFFNSVVVYYGGGGDNIVMSILIIIYEEVLCFFLLHTQFGLVKTGELENELDVTKYLLREKERQFEISKESIELINLKCHDLRHQIRMIGKGKGLPVEMVGEIESAINIYDAEVRTDNETLDIILTEKSLKCKMSDIKLSCVADGRSLDFMDNVDVYSLFGNALDNAIEAVMQLEKDDRHIALAVKSVGNMVSVNVRNPYKGEIKLDEDGLPLTTKEDKNFHGLGVKSIKSIAEKYHGTCAVSLNNDVFVLNVILAKTGE